MIKIIFLTCISFTLNFVNAQEQLAIGTMAPGFEGKNQKGEFINLSSLLEEGPVIITFYRGQWCPHCNRAMSNMQDSLHLIKEQGASIVAITPENLENIEKTIGNSLASFQIIHDENHKIMDDYKVTFKLAWAKHATYKLGWIDINTNSGNDDRVLPVPATYILDKNGIIRGSFYNEDYSLRMSVQDILEILKEISSSTDEKK